MCRRIILCLPLLLLTLPLFGAKSISTPIEVLQPDGSIIHITIVGDETASYKLSSSGYLIAQGDDGFYYYASCKQNGYVLSDKVVSDSGIGISKTIPYLPREVKLFYNNGESFDLNTLTATKSATRMKSIVIPVQFQDLSFSFSDINSKVYNLFNQLNYSYDGATGSVSDYFKDNLSSYGEFLFDISPVVSLSQTMSYYGANNAHGVDANVKEMVKEACRQASQKGVDFSNYDVNGDGRVDNVILFFAGYNEAEGGGDNTIWPQSWNLEEDFTINGMKISGFSCCSELSGSKGNQFTGIGTICHEYCHFLGLMDMYDVNGVNEGFSDGLQGTISIMDRGNYNNDGKTPPYFNSIEREIVKLLSFEEPVIGSRVDLAPVYQSTVACQLTSPNRGESYIIEYRDGSKWDKYIGGEGILVYHIDKSNTMVGSVTALSKWTSNSINSNGSHPCASLISTTGEAATKASDCFFPGDKNIYSILSSISFPLKSWSGEGVAKGILNMEPSNQGYCFQVVKDEAWNLPVVNEYFVRPTQTTATLTWRADKAMSIGNWVLVWGATTSMKQDTVLLKDTEYQFTELKPGEVFTGDIYYQYGSIYGKPHNFTFKTLERMSNLPLIGFVDNQYSVGDKLPLVVLNIVEETESILWSINDAQIDEDSYQFGEIGTYVIQAAVKYTDGSTEILRKRLTVLK